MLLEWLKQQINLLFFKYELYLHYLLNRAWIFNLRRLTMSFLTPSLLLAKQ